MAKRKTYEVSATVTMSYVVEATSEAAAESEVMESIPHTDDMHSVKVEKVLKRAADVKNALFLGARDLR